MKIGMGFCLSIRQQRLEVATSFLNCYFRETKNVRKRFYLHNRPNCGFPTNVCTFFIFQLLSGYEVLFLFLVSVFQFNFNSFKSVAAILEKGLLLPVTFVPHPFH